MNQWRWKYIFIMMILTYFLLILVVYQLPYSYSYYNSLNTNNKNNNNNSKLPINVVVIGSLSYLDQLQSIFDHKIHIYSIKCSKETRIDFKVEIDIVVIEKCRDDYDNQELLHTYQYFDHLIDILKKWKTKFPTASIVWSVPETVRQYSRDDRIIRNFLIKKYIKEGLSVKVIFPYRRKSDSFQRLTKEQVKKSLVDPLQKLLLSYRVDSNSIYNHVQVENGNFSIANHCSKFIHTRKYDDKCFPSPKLDSDKIYPVLITGLGGAGTHFVSNFLNDIGYRFRHERLGKDGSVCWYYAVNDVLTDTIYPFGTDLPARSYLFPRFRKVIHLVRDPIKHISSFTSHANVSYDFLLSNAQYFLSAEKYSTLLQARNSCLFCQRGDPGQLEFAALSWLYWNQHIRSYADISLKIDDIDTITDFVRTHVSTKPVSPSHWCKNKVNTVTYRIKKTMVDWNGLVRQIIGCRTEYSFNSQVHRAHRQFSLKDIESINASLAASILSEAKNYGYNFNDTALS